MKAPASRRLSVYLVLLVYLVGLASGLLLTHHPITFLASNITLHGRATCVTSSQDLAGYPQKTAEAVDISVMQGWHGGSGHIQNVLSSRMSLECVKNLVRRDIPLYVVPFSRIG